MPWATKLCGVKSINLHVVYNLLSEWLPDTTGNVKPRGNFICILLSPTRLNEKQKKNLFQAMFTSRRSFLSNHMLHSLCQLRTVLSGQTTRHVLNLVICSFDSMVCTNATTWTKEKSTQNDSQDCYFTDIYRQQNSELGEDRSTNNTPYPIFIDNRCQINEI